MKETFTPPSLGDERLKRKRCRHEEPAFYALPPSSILPQSWGQGYNSQKGCSGKYRLLLSGLPQQEGLCSKASLLPGMKVTGNRGSRRPSWLESARSPCQSRPALFLSWTICSSLLTSSPIHLPHGNQRFFYNMNLSTSPSSSQVDFCSHLRPHSNKNTFSSKPVPSVPRTHCDPSCFWALDMPFYPFSCLARLGVTFWKSPFWTSL